MIKSGALLHLVLALALAPLLPGIINRVKAKFAGRRGKPVLQLYFDLAKLLCKGEVISQTTTWIFGAGPSIALAAIIGALFLVPFGGTPALFYFKGDFIMAAYLLGLSRFAIILAAVDTGSPFEGMGASREAAFSALAEPAIFLCFACLAWHDAKFGHMTLPGLSLSAMFGGTPAGAWVAGKPELLLIPPVLMAILLTENSRIPVDDPNTHLELTMIHEVMILDHSGPNLAFILYGAALKLWFFAALLAGTLIPGSSMPIWLHFPVSLAVIFLLAVLVGIIESIMARLRILQVPKLLGASSALAALALILTLLR